MCACKVYGPLATYEDCMGTGNTEESNNKSTEIYKQQERNRIENDEKSTVMFLSFTFGVCYSMLENQESKFHSAVSRSVKNMEYLGMFNFPV